MICHRMLGKYRNLWNWISLKREVIYIYGSFDKDKHYMFGILLLEG
jgi:hypothetical protein